MPSPWTSNPLCCSEPMERVRALGKGALETSEGAGVVELHGHLMAELAMFEAATVDDWYRQLSDTSDQKLKQPCLTCAPCIPQPIGVSY